MSKNFNILLIAGHGAGDSGALGCGFKEFEKTRELVKLIKPRLEKYANVYVYPTDRNAFKDVKAGVFKKILNEYFPNVKFGYAFESHFNAFNISAHGTEIFVVPEEKGITVEQEIMKNMKEFFTLRDNDNIFDGVKRTRFLVIKTLKEMGISGALLETCFIDNPNNMKIYEAKKEEIADGIVNGIVTGFGLKENVKKPTPVKVETEEQKHARLVKANAKEYGMKVPTHIKKGQKFWISRYATFYGGAHLGKPIPEKVLKATTSYTAARGTLLKQKYKGKTYSFVLAKEINSYIRIDEIMIK